MHLAVVACGDRLDETFTMFKSAVLFSIKRIKFHIFTEHALASLFEKGRDRSHTRDYYRSAAGRKCSPTAQGT
ncbi:hypothetical protein AAFF_G00231100 [Aldrovandia affinis]|uniref:Uncharacterized protein n=1 Tax=Aldrovandia affinis TaxID=143900 RepID=A0AAD7RFH9_9TELE|nr:hypothetical protein AAFF_G00231100 [Aldrovandia affinis]